MAHPVPAQRFVRAIAMLLAVLACGGETTPAPPADSTAQTEWTKHLGQFIIRKLRADWTANDGGRAAWRAFHDGFLSYDGPPIPLVREQMLGTGEGNLF